MVAASGPSAGAAAIRPAAVTISLVGGVRKATLADVAAIARLSVDANAEAARSLPCLQPAIQLSAPELALRFLEDLDGGDAMYVCERERRTIGFAHLSAAMVGDGGQLVELRRLYVVPDQRLRGVGRELLRFVRRDLQRRPGQPGEPDLRAWAAYDTDAARFFQATGGAPVRQRWKVGPDGHAVRGMLFGWAPKPASGVRPHPEIAAASRAG